MESPSYYTGLDIHKRSITAVTIDSAGEVIEEAKLPCRPAALRDYLAGIPSGRQGVSFEATIGWYWVKDALGDLGHDVKLAHAAKVRAITTAKVKTDSSDARTLAHLHRTDYLPEAHMISDELRPLRDLLRTRLGLVESRIRAQNSISRLLEKVNVESIDDLPASMQLSASCYVEQSALLKAQITRIEKSLQSQLIPDAIVQRLLRIPGIGMINALTIRLEVDDIARFASEKAFFSYCRLVPGANNSGDRQMSKRSRAGNRYLKLAFSHASVHAIKNYPTIRNWYRRKQRKKSTPLARALVAKEIGRIAFHVWSKEEDFNGMFKGLALERVKKEKWPLRPKPVPPADCTSDASHASETNNA